MGVPPCQTRLRSKTKDRDSLHLAPGRGCHRAARLVNVSENSTMHYPLRIDRRLARPGPRHHLARLPSPLIRSPGKTVTIPATPAAVTTLPRSPLRRRLPPPGHAHQSGGTQCPPVPGGGERRGEGLRDRALPDVFKPWTKQSPQRFRAAAWSSTANAFSRTPCHPIRHPDQIQANEPPTKLSRPSQSFAPGIDLAVLKLDDESFLNSHAPLPRATILPQVKDPVMVYGFPTGGTTFRSPRESSPDRLYELLLFHQRAADSDRRRHHPGNSGGPADGRRQDDRASPSSRLAVARRNRTSCPVRRSSCSSRTWPTVIYDGKRPVLIPIRTLENPALRAFSFKLDKSTEGVVVE